MSCTEIVGFNKDGLAEGYAEVENAFRGAMAVWMTLGNRYTGGFSMFDQSSAQKVWDLFNNENISSEERIVLGTTFDKFVVKKENLEKVISAFRNFGGNDSLLEQADILQEILEDEDIIAVGWNQNSVVTNIWTEYKYDEDNEEYIPYNILKGNEHSYLFDRLKQ